MNGLFLLLSLLLAAPAQEAREGFVAADDGVRLHYRIEGEGPRTLVVVHGGPGFSLESVRADLAPLAAHRRVIYYDQRGNGLSTLIDDPAALAVSHHIADLEAIRRHFGLEKMSLFGNSWGGLLISAYAAAHPDRVERLVLDASASPTLDYVREMRGRVGARSRERLSAAEQRRFAEVFQPDAWLAASDPIAVCSDFGRFILRTYVFDPAAALRFRGNLCAGPPEAVRRSLAVNEVIMRSLGEFDLRPAVRRVTAPVLVLHGVADVIPEASARDWAASYPNSRLLLMRRSGHLMHIEEPDAFFAAVETFLAGGWPAGAERVSRGE
ncbi:MAG TPA: alpha/beta hydrolase [Allosphingosinicella sp.]|jgi:proline iminopeptidase|nr:alpha/beta hydrolase [Allosphingosinicella sp.]